MKLFIKNMVCDRCIMIVKAEAEQLGLKLAWIKLGEIHLDQEVIPEETISAAYLSSQFKKVTGMSPGKFRKLMDKKRKPLDSV